MLTRRDVMKAALAGIVALLVPWRPRRVYAEQFVNVAVEREWRNLAWNEPDLEAFARGMLRTDFKPPGASVTGRRPFLGCVIRDRVYVVDGKRAWIGSSGDLELRGWVRAGCPGPMPARPSLRRWMAGDA